MEPNKGKVPVEGIIQVRTIPDEWSDEEFKYWWAPEFDEKGNKIREPRIAQAERDRLFPVEYETHNLLMNPAFTQILTYMSVATSSSAQNFFQFLAIGTGVISGVARTDTTLSTEFYRQGASAFNPVGTMCTVSTNLLAASAQGTWTNVGIFGNGATSTLNSGTMFSHALAAFVKGNVAKVVDYILVLSN
jgi:hypothetical protein